MPVTTPQIKVEAVARCGAEVVLHGDAYDDAYAHAQRCCRRSTAAPSCIPYDDPDVIAGQGTIAMEILRQHQRTIDAIFVPVGGGGLMAGIAAYVKALHPEIKVIGVEPVDAARCARSLDAGKRVQAGSRGLVRRWRRRAAGRRGAVPHCAASSSTT